MASSSPAEPIDPYAIDCTLTDMIDMMRQKLDENDYLVWRRSIQLALGSQGMRHFVDAKVPIPPTEILDPITNKLIPNPEYKEWVETDQYILTQMRRTITEPILNQINGFKTAREVWTHFEKLYFDEHCGKVPELRHRLLTLRKDGLKVDKYFNPIYLIRNDLWFHGHPVSDGDLVRCALGGLGHEYDGFVQGILARPVLPTLSQLYRLVADHDLLFFPQIE
ncbi:hypothetical protein MKX03_031021 [Papaver bracteatum]|nr:hypothetical protein MKX03_031021 [Papaver bracteatum]